MSFGDTRSPSIPCDAGLAGRLAGLRRELFGDDGGGELARRLGVPARTWSNYEGGVTVPAPLSERSSRCCRLRQNGC